MKKLIIVVIIILMLMPTASVINPKVSLREEALEAYGIAGLMAMLPVSQEVKPEPTPEPKAQCQCNKSTGKISYDGGTSLTDCPCKNGASGCGCKNSKKIGDSAPDSTKEVLPRTILVTQIKTCIHCRVLDKNVISKLRDDNHKKSGWRVGKSKSDHFQILDLDDPDAEAEISRLKLDFSSLPTLFFLQSNGTMKKHVGSMTYSSYIEWAKSDVKKK